MSLDEKVFKACLEKYQSRSKDVTWNELADRFGFGNADILRNAFKKERIRRGIPSVRPEMVKHSSVQSMEETYRESTEIKGNGEVSSDKLIRMCEEDAKSPDSVMLAHGFNPELWKVIVCRNNLWHMNAGQGTRMRLYQSRITVAPRSQGEWTTGFVDKIFKSLYEKKPVLSTPINTKYVNNGKMLLVGISDLHLGLLSTDHTTGNDYNTEIAEEVFLKAIGKIKNATINQRFEKIVFMVGNDFINFDNTNGATTHGTMQENDSLWFDVVDKAIELVIRATEEFLKMGKVDVVYVPSNHDLETFYGVMKAVEAYYRNNDNVFVDCSPLPRKYYKYGKNLFGFSHNITLRTALDIITVEAKEMWSSSNHMYWLLAHLHKGMIYEQKGHLEIFRLPAISGWSRWSTNKGYAQTERKAQCFIIDKEDGIVNTLNIVV